MHTRTKFDTRVRVGVRGYDQVLGVLIGRTYPYGAKTWARDASLGDFPIPMRNRVSDQEMLRTRPSEVPRAYGQRQRITDTPKNKSAGMVWG